MKKILVVDDQQNNIIILQKHLQLANFEVLTADNGHTAIELSVAEKPDLILLDVMMPGLSGFEVCKKISSNEVTRDIPIIMVTALTDVTDIEKGLQAGAFDYIKKPFNKTELLARINSALRFTDAKKVLLELEKVNTYSATIVTANHEIKQPLTLINLAISAIRRLIGNENISPEDLSRKIEIINDATKKIIEVLEKLSSIKRPIFTDYLLDTKMVDLQNSITEPANESS